MTLNRLPRPTRSSLMNRRLVKAINALGGNYYMEDGLRTAGRRTELPRARRSETVLALAGAGIVAALGLALLMTA